MSQNPLYPLRFEPIYQRRPWGGRRLGQLLSTPLPDQGSYGEAWILSDREGIANRVAAGPLQGQTLSQIMEHSPRELLGDLAGRQGRFPLLLKFLDASEMLSVQVHPDDSRTDFLPPGESGKTEAWVVLEAHPKGKIYAGLEPGTSAADLRQLSQDTVPEHLASFTPKPGDGVFLPAGTVHTLGGQVVVFEVQQNSDVTFRLYDWDRPDPESGQLRPLQVEQALECIDFAQGAVGPVSPLVESTAPVLREKLFDCELFKLWRHQGESPFLVGQAAQARILVCLGGAGQVKVAEAVYPISTGEVLLLPAALGRCSFCPGGVVTLLEISLPEGK